MFSDKSVLALDFGASSGRAVAGFFDGKKITAKEHRFTNDSIVLNTAKVEGFSPAMF